MSEAVSPFDQFAQFLTPESRRVLDLAREEAIKLKHWFVGTEHILWGLASESSLASFWAPFGITSERIHGGIVFIYDRHLQQNQPSEQQTPSPDTMPDALKLLTPRAKQAIVLAGEEAKKQGEKSIHPIHLVLGLMNEGEGIGAGLLRSLGVSLLQVWAALAPADAAQICSFCGRSGSQVKRIFLPKPIAETAPPSSSICNECVEQFHTMLQQS